MNVKEMKKQICTSVELGCQKLGVSGGTLTIGLVPYDQEAANAVGMNLWPQEVIQISAIRIDIFSTGDLHCCVEQINAAKLQVEAYMEGELMPRSVYDLTSGAFPYDDRSPTVAPYEGAVAIPLFRRNNCGAPLSWRDAELAIIANFFGDGLDCGGEKSEEVALYALPGIMKALKTKSWRRLIALPIYVNYAKALANG